MSVISITITASSTEILPGIPTSITLTSNIPSLIFYTLDGTTPTTYSPLYTSPILLPGLSNIILTIFATDGTNTSDIITQTYNIIPSKVETMAGDRVPHAAVSNVNICGDGSDSFPFGSNSPNPNFQYLNSADAGTTVYNPAEPAISSGFDANENPAVFTNKDPTYYEFNTLYSTSDFEGQVFPGVGNLPAKTTIDGSPYDVEYRKEISSTSDKLFDPKAMVIYVDASTEDPTNPAIIMRDHITLENPEIVRDGTFLSNAGLEQNVMMGSFVRSAYNPRTNEITRYYYDNYVNRWVISKSPYQSTNSNVGNLSGVIGGRDAGNDKVYRWVWNQRRTLF